VFTIYFSDKHYVSVINIVFCKKMNKFIDKHYILVINMSPIIKLPYIKVL